ncbi:DNAse I-like superfamily protein, partial [Striga hermonthica]
KLKITSPLTTHHCSLQKVLGGGESMLHLIPQTITAKMNQDLLKLVEDDEIKEALFSLHFDKSPGEDGMTTYFYQHFWNLIQGDLIEAVQSFFNSGMLLQYWNHIIISLVPKCNAPSSLNQYRPISLCTVVYKVLSKLLASRLKCCLSACISPSKSAFIQHKQLLDSVILAQEVFHFLNRHRSGKNFFMALKLDLMKAFDRVEAHRPTGRPDRDSSRFHRAPHADDFTEVSVASARIYAITVTSLDTFLTVVQRRHSSPSSLSSHSSSSSSPVSRLRGHPSSSSRQQDRVYAVDQVETEQQPGTMSGMIMLNNVPVFALFNTGATHSFISRRCLDAIGVHAITTVDPLALSLASGRKIVTSAKASDLSLSIGGRSLSTDAYVLEMRDFDLILGMDWLSFYHADIRCHDREITLYLPGDDLITFFGTRNRSLPHV